MSATDPSAAYFTKHYAGQVYPRGNHGENVRAVLHLAGSAQDRDDFDLLVDALDLNSTVSKMRKERHAAAS